MDLRVGTVTQLHQSLLHPCAPDTLCLHLPSQQSSALLTLHPGVHLLLHEFLGCGELTQSDFRRAVGLAHWANHLLLLLLVHLSVNVDPRNFSEDKYKWNQEISLGEQLQLTGPRFGSCLGRRTRPADDMTWTKKIKSSRRSCKAEVTECFFQMASWGTNNYLI